MPITREQLHQLVEGLPEQDSIGAELARSIRRGLEQADSGQTIVCKNYSEMVEQVLGE